MELLYVLFEHASGYALFRTSEFEEIALFLPQVQSSILNVVKFRSLVHLIAFQKFENGKEALENMNCISRSTLNKNLQLLLENSIPKTKKEKQTVLGVLDPKLGEAISKTLDITCVTSEVVTEIIRGIRFHFHKLVNRFKDPNAAHKAQLALGNNFSRVKVNFDAKRHDNMIIQILELIDQLEKDISTLSKRVRGWYSYHFPELAIILPDNIDFAHSVQVIQNHKHMSENVKDQLNSVLNKPLIVQKILKAAHNSMGMDISPADIENIKTFVSRILSLHNQEQKAQEYLKAKMQQVAPNLGSLVGYEVGAKLIARSGGLGNLAKLTSTSLQVLGAKNGFFRNLKKQGSKLGILVESEIIKNAVEKNEIRLSRILANKCALAARIDYFRINSDENYGHILLQQVEKRIPFVDRGTVKEEKYLEKANKVEVKDKLEEKNVYETNVNSECENPVTSRISDDEMSHSVEKEEKRFNGNVSGNFSGEESYAVEENKKVKIIKKSPRPKQMPRLHKKFKKDSKECENLVTSLVSENEMSVHSVKEKEKQINSKRLVNFSDEESYAGEENKKVKIIKKSPRPKKIRRFLKKYERESKKCENLETSIVSENEMSVHSVEEHEKQINANILIKFSDDESNAKEENKKLKIIKKSPRPKKTLRLRKSLKKSTRRSYN